MTDKRTKRAILAELETVKRQNAELVKQTKDHFGKNGEGLLADVCRLSEENRGLTEDLAHQKRRVENELKNVKSLTDHVAKQGRQLAVLKGIIDHDRIDVEDLIDRILENA